MRQKQQIFHTFILCFLVSFLLILLSPAAPIRIISGWIEGVFTPLQSSIYNNLGKKQPDDNSELQKLKEENIRLTKEVLRIKTLEQDLLAFRTQLAESIIPVKKLLPAEVIGTNAKISFIDSIPTEITINVGEDLGVKRGMSVVYKNVLLGSVTQVVKQRAIVTLLISEKTILTAKALNTGALGVVRGGKNEMIFGDVLLSEKLESGDTVVTRGDIKKDGSGYPPDLLIGKVSVIDKKPSALFQSARLTPLVDVIKLPAVFVVIP